MVDVASIGPSPWGIDTFVVATILSDPFNSITLVFSIKIVSNNDVVNMIYFKLKCRFSFIICFGLHVMSVKVKLKQIDEVEALTLASQIIASSCTTTCMFSLTIRNICCSGRRTMLFEWFRHFKKVFFRLSHRQIR